MRTALASFVPLLVAACSLSQPKLEQNARAPAGWEHFCFPATIAFLPGTDRISPGTEQVMPTIYDNLRHAEWLYLAVQGGPDANDHAARALANRRAQAALRMLKQLGTGPERVEVHISYDRQVDRLDRDLRAQPSSSHGAATPMDWAVNVVVMIPPEQVERNRARQRENPGLVFC